MMKKHSDLILALVFGVLLSVSPLAIAKGTKEPTSQGDVAVAAEIENQTEVIEDKVIQEANEALGKTREALIALNEGRVDDALDALATGIGKLELVVARHPELSLAPTSTRIETRDIYGSTETLKAAIDEAKTMLRKGYVQDARGLLKDLGSEVVISTTSLPLATYPAAIKAITPLIDQGKIAEASAGLRAALNTLVVTDAIIPLPIVRAQTMLTFAEALADVDESEITKEQKQARDKSLEAVKEQLQMAELLGYGKKRDFESIYDQIEEIEKRIAEQKPSEGFFARAKESIGKLWQG